MVRTLARLRFRWGIATLLTLVTLVGIGLLITVITVLDIRRERAVSSDSLEQRGRSIASTLGDVMSGPLYYTDIDALRDIAQVIRGQSDITFVRVLSPDGRLLVEGPRLADESDYPTGFVDDEFVLGTIRSKQTSLRFIGDSLQIISPIEVGPEVIGAVQFGLDSGPLDAEIREIVTEHVWQALALMAIWAVITYMVSHYATRPLKALASAAANIGRGDLDTYVPVQGTREIVELAGALEHMRLELRQLYVGLESQVAQRTRELARANRGLKKEVGQRKRAQGELQRAGEIAMAASWAKSEFLSNMSHEIRTPMNAIIGMADLLSETPLDAEQQEYVRAFSTAGETLLALINDILDLSKVEAGHLDLERTDFDLRELIEGTVQVMMGRTREKGTTLTYSIGPDVPNGLVGDPVRIRQVLTNLIGNAIKFTGRGEVALDVSNGCGGAPNGTLEFSVSDTGLGIPADRLESIFESFTQGDTSTTREYGGTGLGLSICRRLVELMDGHIWVESTPGAGSTFYFTARFGVSPPGTQNTSSSIDLENLRTLVGDDNATNRTILREMLGGWGASVSEAEDGHQTLAKLLQAGEKQEPYHMLLLDRDMPGLNGFDVVRRIKEQKISPEMVIIMLTSDSQSGDIARCRELGISRYLTKPVRGSDLLQAISSTLGLRRGEVGRETGAQISDVPQHQSPLRILLVEDSEDNRLLVHHYLKKTPYGIDIAENGEVATAKFMSNTYDLVLMDMQMPVMDGYTATREIRKWEAESGVKPTPIVALTASAFIEAVRKSQDAGCDAHINKPVKKSVLLEAIYEHTKGAVDHDEWKRS